MFARARLLILLPAAAMVLLACIEPAPSRPPTTLAQGMPDEVGQCVESTIAKIGGRLEDDPSFRSGTAVRFANGGYQVRHSRVEPVILSRVGDPVRICLVRVPQGCPPGDDRGRVYATTNLRTGGSWRMSDSSHRCGGA